jgi:hypothetical protein
MSLSPPTHNMLSTAVYRYRNSSNTMGILSKLQDKATSVMFGKDEGTGECGQRVVSN